MNTEAAQRVDWEKFCDPKAIRYAIDRPVVIGGMKYATDSRIAIAMPTDEADTDLEWKKFPNVKGVLLPPEAVGDWLPWPEPITECEACGGKATVIEKCDECGGLGERECNLGHDHDCDDCDGTGKCTNDCSECFGTRIQVEDVGIAARYYRLIQSLPGPVEYRTGILAKYGLIHFRFAGGGRGCVMELSK